MFVYKKLAIRLQTFFNPSLSCGIHNRYEDL